MTPPPPVSGPDSPLIGKPGLEGLLAKILHNEEETRAALTEINKRLNEVIGQTAPVAKQTVAPHKSPDAATRHEQYQESNARLLEAVEKWVPVSAEVLVITKGDEALLQIDGRRARHFPQGPDGRYAGYHPADSLEALKHLNTLTAQGAQYLIIPATSLWWLDHYQKFASHLADDLLFRDEAIGAIYALRADPLETLPSTSETSAPPYYEQLRSVVCHLLPSKAELLVISKGDPELIRFDGLNAAHFPQSANMSYAGFHPVDGDAAIAHLEELRAKGASYLLIPQSSLWWLEYYAGLRAYLENQGRLIFHQQHLGVLYGLHHAKT